jgi:hypothetical protein
MIIEELVQHTPFLFCNVEMTCYFGNFQTPSSSNKEHQGQIVPKKNQSKQNIV